MEFFQVVEQRQSIRVFESRPVEKSKLEAILEAANRAPSAGNLQAYEIFVATNAKHRSALARAALAQEFVAQAPVVLVFCAHPARSKPKYGERGIRLYSVQDATVACTFAMLAAVALGLATVWVGAFSDEAVHHVIGSPAGLHPVAVLPIGYPAETPERTSRRRLQGLVHEL